MAEKQPSTDLFSDQGAARPEMTTTDNKRIALYSRVSTTHGQDPQMQLRELREYAQRRELQVVEEYTDNGVSGSKDSRPALNRLMADADSQKFDAVLVWKIDRWGRSLKQHLVCKDCAKTIDNAPPPDSTVLAMVRAS